MNWAIFSAVMMGIAIVAFFWNFEKQGVTTKEVSLIATMATLAAVTRIPFAAIINVQPTTFIVMITGFVFGARSGFMVGALAALVSNIFLGQGPWTPWQMFAWGLAGFTAGLLGGYTRQFNLFGFAILLFLWGYLFGWIMNIWHWVGFVYPLNLKTFIATYLASFPFDTLHAICNVAFAIMFGKTVFNILVRYRNKISFVKYEI